MACFPRVYFNLNTFLRAEGKQISRFACVLIRRARSRSDESRGIRDTRIASSPSQAAAYGGRSMHMSRRDYQECQSSGSILPYGTTCPCESRLFALVRAVSDYLLCVHSRPPKMDRRRRKEIAGSSRFAEPCVRACMKFCKA